MTFVITFLLGLSLVPMAHAQGVDAAIVGIVEDASRAAVPGASVTARQTATGFTRTTVSDPAGGFEILALPIGPYEVTVEKQGFRTWYLQDVRMEVGQRLRIQPMLEVGTIAERITVEAAPTPINTENAALGTVVETAQMQELPLSGRDYTGLAELAPGILVSRFGAGFHVIQGQGFWNNMTDFQLNGVSSTERGGQRGMLSPPLDSLAELNVQTNNFSAESGRFSMIFQAVTKTGTNDLHVSLWEFLQNEALNARQASALSKPFLRRNQFGLVGGGPIIRNKTFFFGSFEATLVRGQAILNNRVPPEAFYRGDFSSLSVPLRDPAGGNFPNNIIPQGRWNPASKFFFPFIAKPNSADGRFLRLNASNPTDDTNFLVRVDHQLTSAHRIYGHVARTTSDGLTPGYDPVRHLGDTLRSHPQAHVAAHYDWVISPGTLLVIDGGYLRDHLITRPPSDQIGKRNYTQEAGIQGFPSEGREAWLGLPIVTMSPYSGFRTAGSLDLVTQSYTFGGSLRLVEGKHSAALGAQYVNGSLLETTTSCCQNGEFRFGSAFTGDAFADFLLGYPNRGRRNYPLHKFGQTSMPYMGFFAQDSWKVSPTLTLTLGLRYDFWFGQTFYRGQGAAWDAQAKKVVAGTLDDGTIDLNAQPTSAALYNQYKDYIISAKQAGHPPGLWHPDRNNFAPRLGAAWRPFGVKDFVVRGGYGIFYTEWDMDAPLSQVTGLPFWALEGRSFSSRQPSDWRSIFPLTQTFSFPGVGGVDPRQPMLTIHQWNVSVEKTLPLSTALELSYVGTRGSLSVGHYYNVVPPGDYDDLQAALPYPQLGSLWNLTGEGKSWYDAFQLKAQRRFRQGLSYQVAYSLGKMREYGGQFATLTPFAPAGWDRGPSSLDRRHILTVSWVYDIPIGKDRYFGKTLPGVLDAIVGGWGLAGFYRYRSGRPLSVSESGDSLGNDTANRADLVGDPKVSHPSAEKWFNPAAFANPAPHQFGNSPIGIITGPSYGGTDVNISKKFRLRENTFLHLRWEMYNAFNQVFLGNPDTTLNTGTTGRIFGAQQARTMQLGLKLTF
ncbi:MAG TPA: TonB-dependent receptor [Terriglobales bacterium]|nr:TonB-dependent receptor [Terriglobales bacterium]